MNGMTAFSGVGAGRAIDWLKGAIGSRRAKASCVAVRGSNRAK